MGGRLKTGRRAKAIAAMGIVMVVGLIVGPTQAVGDTTPGPGLVDLSVEVFVTPNPVAPGAEVTIEGLVSNDGTLMANQVVALLEVSADSVAAEIGGESCSVVGSRRLENGGSTRDQPWTVTCELGALAPGTETHFALSVTAGEFGTQMASVVVSSRTNDAWSVDHNAEVPVHVLPSAPEFVPAFQQPGRLNPSGRTSV